MDKCVDCKGRASLIHRQVIIAGDDGKSGGLV